MPTGWARALSTEWHGQTILGVVARAESSVAGFRMFHRPEGCGSSPRASSVRTSRLGLVATRRNVLVGMTTSILFPRERYPVAMPNATMAVHRRTSIGALRRRLRRTGSPDGGMSFEITADTRGHPDAVINRFITDDVTSSIVEGAVTRASAISEPDATVEYVRAPIGPAGREVRGSCCRRHCGVDSHVGREGLIAGLEALGLDTRRGLGVGFAHQYGVSVPANSRIGLHGAPGR